MRYKLLGRSGLRGSEICLGAVSGASSPAGAGDSQNMCRAFVDAGGNFFDTANMYAGGESERFLGQQMGANRPQFVIGTKYTLSMRRDDPNGGGNHRKSMMESLEGSL